MTRLERVVQIATLVANVGVLLGFVLVAWQLRIATESLEASALGQASDLGQTSEAALMGDTAYLAVTKAILTPAELTPPEIMQVWGYFAIAHYTALQAYQDYRSGRMSGENWVNSRDFFIGYFNYPFGRIWWEETAGVFDSPLSEAFEASIQERLDELPANQAEAWLRNMHARAQALGAMPPEETSPE